MSVLPLHSYSIISHFEDIYKFFLSFGNVNLAHEIITYK